MTGYFAKSHVAGGSVLAAAVLPSRCVWVHPSQSAPSALGDTSVLANTWDLSWLPLWKPPSWAWKHWVCRVLLSQSWMIAGEIFFFVCRGLGLSIWTVCRFPFLYLGEMGWWAQRWSACCSHQQGRSTVCFFYVVPWPLARCVPAASPVYVSLVAKTFAGPAGQLCCPCGWSVLPFLLPPEKWCSIRGFVDSDAGLSCLAITDYEMYESCSSAEFDCCSSFAVWGNSKLSCLFQFTEWFTNKSLAFLTSSFYITSNGSCGPE